jgi:hypothetical protein
VLQEFGLEVFEHPAYCSDLAPSDFHLFLTLKGFVGDRLLQSDDEVKDAVKQWLNGLTAEVYHEGIQNLVTGYDKCQNGTLNLFLFCLYRVGNHAPAYRHLIGRSLTTCVIVQHYSSPCLSHCSFVHARKNSMRI